MEKFSSFAQKQKKKIQDKWRRNANNADNSAFVSDV